MYGINLKLVKENRKITTCNHTIYGIKCQLLFEITLCYEFLDGRSHFYQQGSNWLFGHYRTLMSSLRKK